jgi:hypothetical protein
MIPQGSPRISLEGFTVRRTPREKDEGRAPRIHLKLSKRDYPMEGIDPFSPLRLPEHVEVRLRDIDSALIDHGSGQVDIGLSPGTHRLPLAGRHHFIVEVSEDTVARASFEIGAPPSSDQEPKLLTRMLGPGPDDVTSREHRRVVRTMDLTFDPPLLLPNLLPTLLEVQELFRDRGLASLVSNPVAQRASKRSIGAGTHRFLDTLGMVASSANRLGFVLLQHVRGEPVYRARTGRWELKLSFSGHVQLAGGVPLIPFNDVVLPSLLLPIPYASVDDLLSDEPLASADIRSDRVRIDEAIAGVRGIFSTFEGRVFLRSEIPKFLVQAEAVDRTDMNVTVTLPSELTVEGRIGGKRQGDTLIVDAEDLTVGFPEPSMHIGVRALIEDLGPEQGPWTSRLRAHLENTVAPGSQIPLVDVEVDTSHPFATGDSKLGLTIRDICIEGGAGGMSFAGPSIDLWPMSRRVEFSADVSTRADVVVQEVGLRSELRVPSGHVEGALELGADGLWHLGLDGTAGFDVRVVKQVPGIPELSIDAGDLVADVRGKVTIEANTNANFELSNAIDLELSHGKASVELSKAEVAIEDRRITFAPGTMVEVTSQQASMSSSGFGELAFDVAWDMQGAPCLLHAGERTASLLAPDLRAGDVTVHLSPEGQLSFSGERQGLYGIRYFNTLLNPAADPEHLAELLRSEEAMGHVLSTLELLSPELADQMSLVRDLALGFRRIAERSGIREVRHFIPRDSMALFMSLLLAGDTSLKERIARQVQSVTEARGLDVIEMKNLLREHLDEFDADYEIGGIVRWLEILLRPAEPVVESPPVQAEPRAVSPEYADEVAGLPSAGEIYEQIESGSVTQSLLAALCRLAPRLTPEQLSYLVRNADASWGVNRVKWLRFVHAVKRRVERIANAYGGVEYAFQEIVISTFLGEAVADGSDPGLAADDAWDDRSKWPPACALGSEGVAVLLKAGLALDRQNRRTQINNRMLLDLMRSRPARFTLDVLADVGQHNPRALSGILFAFIEQEQDHMSDPIDLPAFLEDKLGMTVPRRRDFMAGGCRARDSYWGALSELAEAVLGRADASYAVKSHLQVQRHPVPTSYRARTKHKNLIEKAKKAIAVADEAGAACKFTERGATGPTRRAIDAYRSAFDACTALLTEDRAAFQAGWLRSFWLRNEEALKLLSVVRNYQNDIDRVRPWLHRVTGQRSFRHEQELLTAVVGYLISDPRDRKKLLRDPLVRLLIDPLPGRYDFTIVSAMGVITEGERGTELEDAFGRLTEQRGVRVIRAPTGTAMSLEENAKRIISSIEQLDGPFGLIGYSQGCANALAAESMLRGGTPDQQRMVERLVCRNFLFSALNGSAHGAYGSEKFQRAMVEGERFLKHYQVMFSSEAVASFLRIARAVVDSSVFVRVLGGVHSLTVQRATDFHREMQVVEHAPTSTLRGVILEEDLPETLELTYYLLRHMTSGAEQDTQVIADDALGHSTRTLNPTTRLLKRCDMSSMRERTHHWSPLKKETEFVTTPRDRERCVYDSPKDRHVFPWVEVNARFGMIRRV